MPPKVSFLFLFSHSFEDIRLLLYSIWNKIQLKVYSGSSKSSGHPFHRIFKVLKITFSKFSYRKHKLESLGSMILPKFLKNVVLKTF
jgi:hypothetical protein